MLAYCNTTDTPALFVAPRGGKTVVSCQWIAQKDFARVLVVAPYPAFYGWMENLRKINRKLIVLSGSGVQKSFQLYQSMTSSPRRVVLVNVEAHRILPELSEYQWDCVILDESTRIKTATAAVSKYFVKHFDRVPYKMVLTGTPDAEGELDIFQQLRFLDRGILDCDNYYQFQHRYCIKPFMSFRWEMTQRGRAFLAERLARHCFTLESTQMRITGELETTVATCVLDNSSRAVYDEIERLLVVKVDDEVLARTLYSLVAFQWMRQLAGGILPQKPNTAKLDLLRSLLTRRDGKFVVFCNYIDEILLVQKLLVEMGFQSRVIRGAVGIAERMSIQAQFVGGMLDAVVCQTSAIQWGADLAKANTAYVYSCPLSRESYIQMQSRILNTEKKAISHLVLLAVENTVDIDIIKSQERKERNHARLTSLVAEIRRRVNCGNIDN